MKTILCYGDSNTWGVDPEIQSPSPLYSVVRIPYGRRWPNVLEQKLGEGYHVIEDGINGRTAGVDDPCLNYRNGLKTLHPALLAHAPLDLIVIMLGENDTKQRIGLKARDIVKGHEQMVGAVRGANCGPEGGACEILLVAPPVTGPDYAPSYEEGFGYGRETSLRLPATLQKVAGVLQCHYFDCNSVAANSPIDGVHLDKDAHRALGEGLAEYIRSNIYND